MAEWRGNWRVTLMEWKVWWSEENLVGVEAEFCGVEDEFCWEWRLFGGKGGWVLVGVEA